MSRATVAGPYDVSLVEGSITTPADAHRIRQVRESSRRLVTIGACATAGGIQGLRNFAASGEYAQTVYAHPEYITSLDTSTPIADHVDVDFELHGCPIDRHQLLEVITATLAGRRPVIAGHSVCQQCKGRGTVCLLVSEGIACLGPVTRTGCGALCPAVGRGCFGCFGPADTTNAPSLAAQLRRQGMAPVDVSRLFRTLNAGAPAFLEESVAQGGSLPVARGVAVHSGGPEEGS
jgi:coenzyme F420-reducing hydrogenase gamma subunit